MAAALGYRFLDASGNELAPIGENLVQIEKIEGQNPFPKIQFVVLTDVDNPLHGPHGAAHVFAKQKGATALSIKQLDKGLINSARWLPESIPGAGAAGGLGAGAVYFLGAKISSGAEWLLNKVNLFEHRKKAVSSYSGGMRQRFGIAQCLIGNPKLVIVDEPTAGLDPGERNRFYNILSEIGENIIVILSTHIVQDVRELCTQMAIMDKGKVLFSGNTDDALHQIKGKVWERKVGKDELLDFQTNYKIISSKLVGGKPLIHAFSENELGNGFSKAEENLEDVFFAKLNELV
jgi:ABC-type sugar transport system ATPase subunit